MTKKLRIKRRQTGAAGPPATLLNAELAFNETTNTLFYGKGETVNNAAAAIIPIGGDGAFVALSGTQTVAGSKTFTGLVNAVTPPVVDNSTLVATTEFVKQQYYLTRESIVDGGLVVGAGTTTANILSTEDNLALYTENYAVLTV
jgi:hypothetical protein